MEDNIIHKFLLNNSQYVVDLENDFYGLDFWKKFIDLKYEPDTFNFIQKNVDEKTIFLDIGCANAPFTILALSRGGKVYAYEPNPDMYAVAFRNIILNQKMQSFCEILNCAVSIKPGSIEFNRNSDAKILSPIVFSEPQISKVSSVIQVKSLRDEINRVFEKGFKLLIKMDIEGAEWLIINDDLTLESLRSHSSLLLLAVHPGFSKPLKKRFKGYDFFAHKYFVYKNYKTSVKTFKKITNFGKVYRTNLNQIESSHKFGMLVMAGYHEFIVDFGS